MKNNLYIDGVHYLTAREAGDVLGYAPDYVSRLCREGKLRGRRSGKTWIVEADSLVPFIKAHEAKKEAWHQNLSRELKSVAEPIVLRDENFQPLSHLNVAPRQLHILRASEKAHAAREAAQTLLITRITVSSVFAVLLLFIANTTALSTPIANMLRGSSAEQVAAASFFSPLESIARASYNSVTSLTCTITGWCDEVQPMPVVYVRAPQQPIAQAPAPTQITNNITNYIQPTVGSGGVLASGVSEQLLDSRLNAMENYLTGQIDLAMYEGRRQTEDLADDLADGIGGGGFDNIDITDSSWSGGSISGASISGSTLSGVTFSGAQAFDALEATDATTTNATSTNMYVSGSFGFGSGTGLLQTSSGVASTLANGSNGQVLKMVGGNLTWSTDLTGGGGGGASFFASTTDDLAIYPADPDDVVIIGNSATTTVGNILEIAGNSLFRGAVTSYGNVSAPRFTATSSSASVFPYASTTALSTNSLCISGDCRQAWPDSAFSTTSADYWQTQRNFFSTTSADYYKSVNNFFSTSSADYWKTANNFFSTTSADAWKEQRNFFSTTSASYFLTQNQGNAFSTTSADHLLSTYNKGFFFSTTSAQHFLTQNGSLGFSTTSNDYWMTQRNFFSTSSADYYKSVNNFFSTSSASYFATLGLAFSTTSSDYWKSVNNFFSTSSADYYTSVNNFFSTTSADAWKLTRDFFSTTSASYFLSQNQSLGFSTTSANYFAASSTTIPKTYVANTFTALQTFGNASSSIFSADTICLSTDCRTAWPTAGSSFEYPFFGTGNSTSTLVQFNGGLTAYASSTIGNGSAAGGLTVNGTATTSRLVVSGTGTSTFAGDILMGGSIIPSADNTYSLGSESRMWKDVYIGPGSLYVNGKKVIEDVSNTITISTDNDQNLMSETSGVGNNTMRATGSGNLNLLSSSGNINVTSTSGNINIGTSGSGQLNLGIIASGTWQGTVIADAYLTKSGNWTGTLDGYEASQLLGGSFSTTSSDYWKNQRDFFSTTSANYFLSQNQGAAFSTTSAQYFLSQQGSLGFSTTSNDYWLTQRNFFSTTSADAWKDQRDFFSTTSASYFASVGLAFSTTSNDYWKSVNNFFSTTSADAWKLTHDFFSTSSASYFSSIGLAWSTTSANYYLSQNGSLGFSTTSNDYWMTQRNFFSTSSADYYKSVNNFFSTSSADYWQTTKDFFSTTSTSYFLSQNQSLGFSTTSAQYFVHSSTTIPKTYTTNTFTVLQSFANASSTLFSSSYASTTNLFANTASTSNLTISALQNGLLRVGADGTVSLATAGTDYATFGYLFPSNATSTLLSFNGGLIANASSSINALSSVISTSTSATSTNFFATNGRFLNATTTNLGINSETFTDLTGTGLQNVGGALTLNATGDWTGTFDGLEGSVYLANAFSTTSADYWKLNRDFFSTTSADYYVHSSTTIPKTYTANSFSALQIFTNASSSLFSSGYASSTNLFAGAFTLGSLNGPLQANNGLVSATTSIGVLYGGTGLTAAPGYGQLLMGNGSGGYTLTATSSLGITGGSTGDQIAIIVDQKADQVDGGTFTAGAWQTRDINTELRDDIGITISSNQFTLPAGTYEISASAPAYNVDQHQARLFDVSNGTTTLIGTSGYSDSGGVYTQDVVFVVGTVVATTTTTYRLEHRAQVTQTTNGFGVSSSFTGVPEMYSTIRIRKLNGSATVATFTGASASTNGTAGLVPQPQSGEQGSILLGNGNWLASTTLFVNTTNARLGLGTTSPNWKLSVAGDASFDSFARASYFTATSSVASTLPFASSTAITVSGTASTTNLVVSSAGGTAGCATFSSTGLLSNTGVACGSGSAAFPFTPGTFGATAVNATSTALQLTGGLFASSTIRFGSAGVDNFLFDSATGRLGLGTTTPNATLTVYGDTLFNGTDRYTNFGTTTGTSGYGFRDNGGVMEFKNANGTWQGVTTATTGPSFSVHKNGSDQSFSASTWTKVTWSTEEFDTNNNFSSDRFTPSVPGKYIISSKVDIASITTNQSFYVALYKNGAEYRKNIINQPNVTTELSSAVTAIVDANGSDYFEVYVWSNHSSPSVEGTNSQTYFTGAMIAPVNGNNAAGWANDGSASFLLDNADRVGVGTSTPWAKLAIQGDSGQLNPVFEVASSSTATKFLSVSSTGFGTTTLSGLNISGSATTTSNVGMNIASGCYAINGTCISGGSGSSLFTDGGATTYLTSADNLGLGTTTAGSKLTIFGDVLVEGSNRYLNFGTTTGANGYGFRDNAGVMEFKNANGTWQGVTTATTGPSFLVTKTDGSDDQNPGGSGLVLVTWNVEHFDTNNNFDLSTERFTPTVPGKYIITGEVQCNSTNTTSDYCGASIYKNGSEYKSNYASGNSGNIPRGTVTVILDMNGTTDYVELYGRNSASGTFDGDQRFTYFSGAMIAPVNGNNAAGWANDGSASFLLDNADKVGVGTTTPWAKLAIQGDSGQLNPVFEVASSSTATKFLSVSSTGFGTTTLSGLNISGAATSTSNVGMNITSGCYAINGTCISGGSGSSLFTDGGATTYLTSADNLGLGTTTAGSKLTIFGDVLVEGSNRYLNFGTTTGANGYGFRDNAGVMEFKNANGTWQGVTTATTGPSFSVHKNGTSQTVTANAFELVTWSTEIFDTNNNFNLATERFTPTVPGKYIISLAVRCLTTTTRCMAGIYKNGSPLHRAQSDNGSHNNPSAVVTAIVDMNGSTDYLEGYGFNGGGTSLDGDSDFTNFTGAMIAPVNGNNAAGWANDGTQSFLLDNADLVGVGTTTPWGKLSISSTAGIPQFVIGSSTATQFLVDALGNVGIGTTTPGSNYAGVPGKFVVSAAGNSSIVNDSATDGISAFTLSENGGSRWLMLNRGGSDDSFEIYSSRTVGESAARFSILQSGNVGIGTSTPAVKTEIVGTISDTINEGILRIQGNGTSVHADMGILSNAANRFPYIQSIQTSPTTASFLLNPFGGSVGIGVTTPGRTLEVSGTGYFTSTLYVGSDSSTSNADDNVVGTTVSSSGYIAANRSGSLSGYFGRTDDGGVVAFYSAGTNEGGISISGTAVSYNAFTGSHYGTTNEEIERGSLVEFDGTHTFKYGTSDSEPTYGIRKTTQANSSAVFGSFLSLVEPLQPHDPILNPYLVMAVGNGDMWVVQGDEESIEPGDYLISSNLAGHAMKDPGTYMVSHIVARAAQKVDWDTVASTTESGLKRAKISVTFEQFDRNVALSDVFAALLASSTATSTDETEVQQFASGFMSNLFSRMTTWLADAGNGITEIFAKTIRAENVYADTVNANKLCLEDLCVTKAQLQQMLNESGAAPASTPEEPVDEPEAETPPDEPKAEEPAQEPEETPDLEVPEEVPESAPEESATPPTDDTPEPESAPEAPEEEV